jgi:hypothetical protein
VSHRAALLAQADALEAQAGTLRALATSLPDATVDEQLTLAQIREQFGYGDEAIRAAIARGELAGTRGPRQRIEVRRSELERWRASTPAHVKPRARRRGADVIDLDTWERECDRELAAGGSR